MNKLSRKDIADIVLNDTKQAREHFLKVFSAQTEEFIDNIARAYSCLSDLDILPHDKRTGWVQIFIFSSFNSLLTSFHLPINGFLIPSGNLMRQWAEGMAMALLCCDTRINVFKTHETDPTHFSVQNAPDLVLRKSDAHILGINKRGWTKFQQMNDLYQKYSHASVLSLASMFKMDTDGGIIIGSEFDNGKISAYEKEIKRRISACSLLIDTVAILKIHLLQKN